MSAQPLPRLNPEDRARVVRLGGPGRLVRRLLALGLRPGAEVMVLRRAPLGDPLEVQVGASLLLSIRHEEACHVLVGTGP